MGWAIALVFALSAWEKLRTLKLRTGRWHPMLMPTTWRRNHATQLLIAAAFADFVVVVLGVAGWRAASVIALCLIGAYTVFAQRATFTSGCRCFSGLLDVHWRFG
jgi:hypothetical protein